MPAEPELLDSATDRDTGRPWALLAAVPVVLALVATLTLLTGPANDAAPAPPAARPSTPSEPAAPAEDLITGTRPATNLSPSGNAAIGVARTVVEQYCDRIESWRVRVEDPAGDYTDVVLVLTPAGPAYRSVSIRLEVTWQIDHYTWAGSRAALETCP